MRERFGEVSCRRVKGVGAVHVNEQRQCNDIDGVYRWLLLAIMTMKQTHSPAAMGFPKTFVVRCPAIGLEKGWGNPLRNVVHFCRHRYKVTLVCHFWSMGVYQNWRHATKTYVGPTGEASLPGSFLNTTDLFFFTLTRLSTLHVVYFI